ncbi:MAG TPA: CHAT domain-containing protein [Gemmatimonadaceae bacterium]|nr:CHAT domain-containing protein [Gemmatimonadaceae bacterium]
MPTAQISYLDFDICVERTPDGRRYRARVLNSPGGQAVTEFDAPLSPNDIELIRLKVSRPRGVTRGHSRAEVDTVKDFGARMYGALFGGEVGTCLQRSKDLAQAGGHTGVRVRLRLTEAPELAELPWEYVYQQSVNRFLSVSPQTPLVRYLDLPDRVRPLQVTLPLRVLVMISSPSNLDQLDASVEWQRLKDSFADLEGRGLVRLDRLDEATLPALRGRLKKEEYHVFHYIGHGSFDRKSGEGTLLLEDHTDGRRALEVSAERLGVVLHEETSLRLVFLNACEGARASANDLFAGTAQALVQQDVPAVIAMQFEITDGAAITFTHEFYKAVAEGSPVDAALAEARQAVFLDGNEVEWGTPVLYMRAADGRIFDIPRSSSEVRLPPAADGYRGARPEPRPPRAADPPRAPEGPRVSSLIREGSSELLAENYPTAVRKFEEATRLDPGSAEAARQLQHARRQQELALRFDEGCRQLGAGNLHAALAAFERVREAANANFRGVDAQIATVRRELQRAETERMREAQREAQARAEAEERARLRQAEEEQLAGIRTEREQLARMRQEAEERQRAEERGARAATWRKRIKRFVMAVVIFGILFLILVVAAVVSDVSDSVQSSTPAQDSALEAIRKLANEAGKPSGGGAKSGGVQSQRRAPDAGTTTQPRRRPAVEAGPDSAMFADLFGELRDMVPGGFRATALHGSGYATEGNPQQFQLPLRAGVGYHVVATCNDCDNTGIALKDPDAALPLVDVAPGEQAHLVVTPALTKRYDFSLAIEGCAAARCAFAYRVFSNEGVGAKY